MPVYNDISELIGRTPVVRLNNMPDKDAARVLVKLERTNPGGSIKDRPCLNMIRAAEKRGELKPGGTIIEATSGNTGIGLALIGAVRGYRVILTMPENMSVERRKLLKAYGAEIVLTPAEKGMKGAIQKAEEILASSDNCFMARQFENPDNPEIHRLSTGKEILEDTDGQLDYFVAAVGTGGTLSGVARVLKDNISGLKVVAVEPRESAVLLGEEPGPHKIQGIGAGFIPEVLDTELINRVIKISGDEAIKTTRELARKEGILAGISSGAAVAAALKIALGAGKGKTVLTIAPDSGERYLSTELFDY